MHLKGFLHCPGDLAMDFTEFLLNSFAMFELFSFKLTSIVHSLSIHLDQQHLTDATTVRTNISIGGLVIVNDGANLGQLRYIVRLDVLIHTLISECTYICIILVYYCNLIG